MKVRELIQELSKFDGDKDVIITSPTDGNEELAHEICDIQTIDYVNFRVWEEINVEPFVAIELFNTSTATVLDSNSIDDIRRWKL